MIILTPESILGKENRSGVVDLFHRDRLKFIVIDKAHLVYEWAVFRKAFHQLETLLNKFQCPIIILTATLKPECLREMEKTVLRNQ